MAATVPNPNERAEGPGCLLPSASLLLIPSLLLTATGVWLGGLPAPGQVAPMRQPRAAYMINESRWCEEEALKLNDLSFWNEKAKVVLHLPPNQRAAEQEAMIKEGLIPETFRLRALTSPEQKEMETKVKHARQYNDFLKFREVWAFFGFPLSVLSTLLYVFSALGCRKGGYYWGWLAALLALDLLNLLLSWWNFQGTSFD